MRTATILAIFVLLHAALSRWDVQTKIYSTDNSISDQHMWLDESTGYHHIVFSERVGKVAKAMYLVHYLNNTVLTKEFLPGYQHYTAHITGAGDGKHVFIVFSASRTPTNTKLADVFFAESANGGVSWSEPVRLPRPNMDDSDERKFPKLVFVRETGRLFVFFCRQNNGKYRGVYYVGRAKDSTVFSSETAIDTRFQLITDLSATYTYSSGMATVFVHWFTEHRDPTKGVHIGAVTQDNGVHWTVIKSGHYEYNQRTNLVSSAKFDPLKALVIYNCIGGHIFEVVFDVKKKTFSEMGSQMKADKTFWTDIAFCADRAGDQKIYYFGTKLESDQSAHMNFYRWDLKGSYDMLDRPFQAFHVYSSSAACDQQNFAFVVSTVLVDGSIYSLAINKWSI